MLYEVITVVLLQTFFAPRSILAIAYDSGGVTTSTVTVPIVAALGLGLSAMVPGRNPAIDGFGLIAFARITSYNVCYTKLLRKIRCAKKTV